MAALTRLTDDSAVIEALSEWQQIGRSAFLSKYGFDKSRDYFVEWNGQLIDSKPILAAAWGYQFPAEGALEHGDFSGGNSATARALSRLGFRVVTAAQLKPPAIGDNYDNRTAVYETYGGDKVSGIIRFPGDAVVNVFSDEEGAYHDDPPTLTEPFGYRGEGLSGPQSVSSGGNVLLEDARKQRTAVRFWHRPSGGEFSFLTWAVVLGRAWVPGVGADRLPRPELEWKIQAVTSPEPDGWSASVRAALEDVADEPEDNLPTPESAPAPTYDQLVARVNARGQQRRPTGAVRVDYARSAAARRAVLVRAAGNCENTECSGMPCDTLPSGATILDVDHIKDLARGGEDHPTNMIALCPNCHAAKTRGKDALQWRSKFTVIARDAHQRALHTSGASVAASTTDGS